MPEIKFVEESHRYYVDDQEYVSVTQVLMDMGLYGDAANFWTEYSRDRGTFVHKAIELYVGGELDEESLHPVLLPYLIAFKSFMADTDFVPSEMENPHASDIHLLAGTPDFIGVLNGKLSVVDIKTGEPGPAVRLQLAAYELLYGKPLKRYSLHLMETGKYKLTCHDGRQDRAVFLAALSVYHWRKNHNIK